MNFKQKKSPSKRILILYLCAGCSLATMLTTIAGIILLWHHATKIEPDSWYVNHQNAFMNNWHPEHDGLKVAILSDTHINNNEKDLKRNTDIIEKINSYSPDIIFLLGDYSGGNPLKNEAPPTVQKVAEILGNLKAKYGVFAVLGNHDWDLKSGDIRDEFPKHGITVLENEYRELEINGKKLNIIGLPDKQMRHRVIKKAGVVTPENSELPTIVLSHEPIYFTELKLPYELMLSGHTHGGQVRLPFYGPLILPKDTDKNMASGWYEADGNKIFITSGSGSSFIRIRLFCRPEFVIMTFNEKKVK